MKIMLSNLISLLSLLLLVPHAATTWSTPIKLMEVGDFRSIDILSLYRDPVSSVNHIFVAVGIIRTAYHYHMALKDDGTVLYKTFFDMVSQHVASLRGAGDGKGLFLVYSSGAADIMFSESSDGGANWSDARNIADDHDSPYKVLGDMVRVNSGRLFVIFANNVRDKVSHIRMVSRPMGSSVFSKESVIATDANRDYQDSVAAYGYRGGKLRLYVAYLRYGYDKSTIVYTYSDNNGVSWSKGRDLDGTMGTWNINYMKNMGEHLYISYRPFHSNASLLVHSSNFGDTFGSPQEFYVGKSMALATCSARNYKKLASLQPAGTEKFKYATWDPATLKSGDAQNITFPEVYYATNTAIDCAIDLKKSLRKVVAFITTINSVKQLFMSVDTAATD